MQEKIKLCSKCKKGEILPWHLSYCRECYRELDRRRYYQTYKRREEVLECSKKRYERDKALFLKRTKLIRLKFPEKYKARYELRNAVKSGKVIKQPCIICGNKKSQGHHEDYSKPLEVIWLCSDHHNKRHRRFEETGLAKLTLIDKL